jgi:hypothetical protein
MSIVLIFCRGFSKRNYSVFFGVSFWIISMLYHPSHVRFSRNIFSASCWTTRYFIGVLDGYSGYFSDALFELSLKFVGHFTAIFLMLYNALQIIWLGILSGVSRSVSSIFCRACQGAIHRQFVWRLRVIFFIYFCHFTSIIQVICRAYCSEYSQYVWGLSGPLSGFFGGSFAVNCLEFRRVSFGQVTRHFFGRCTMNFFETSNF